MSTKCAFAAVVLLLIGCQASGHWKEATVREESSSGTRAEAGRPAGQGEALVAVEAGGRVAGMPEGWELVPKATYTATQEGGQVTIRAKGENPTAGYQTKLFQSMLRIWPPQYLLGRKRPDGPAAQVITPFDVTASFKAAEPVKEVQVSDGAGKHEVKVEAK